ncbi:hypothetical protein GOP47_0030496 [Adiantum capillus-veneris]|nr:hypothetical protein GOP47_0030496 [Adiantum capillus-veneris]
MDKCTRRVLLYALLLLPYLQVLCEDDTECLKAFKESVTDTNNSLATWNFGNVSRGYVCNFAGVTCWNPQENRVLALKLPQAGLSGSFPSGLQKCASMQTLDLSQNGFSGPIPDNICSQLPYTTVLDLSKNGFTGFIPNNLQDCLYLNTLHLQHNQFSGYLPGGIGILPRLRELDVSYNKLSGVIPSSFSTQPPSAFGNNPGLCGPPLNKQCASGPNNVGLIVGAAVASAAVVAFLAAFGFWWVLLRARKKERALLRDENKWAKCIRAPRSVSVSLFEKPLKKLKLADLMAATGDFNRENIIGSGRTGTIYKAFLPDGSMLAVKRLRPSSQTDKQFASEMDILGKLRHRNLVPLLGYCCAGSEKLLVYKHMVNGSLKDCLHEMPEKNKPDWTTRLRIGLGAARGFAWLHHSCNPRIIHRNISSESILLDDEYESRITDFGLARLMDPVDTHVSTFVNGDFGDLGYVAPEYSRTLVATVKGDVYSFGVVLLELVTGQRATDVCAEAEFKGNLAEWVAFLSKNGCLEEAIDMSLTGRGHDNELNQFLRVGCACVLPGPKDRPTMYEVYQFLKAIGQNFSISDNDELPLFLNKEMDYADELIVARHG